MTSNLEWRKQCGLIRRYPFRTKVLSQSLQELNENHPLAGLLRSLESYEQKTLFRLDNNEAITRYLRAMLEYEYLGLTQANLTAFYETTVTVLGKEVTLGHLCSLMTVYRVIDLYAGHPAVEPNATFAKNEVVVDDSKPIISKIPIIWPALQDWPRMLKKLTTRIKTLTKLQTSKVISDNISKGVHVDHLFEIAQRKEMGKLIHVLDNLQTAAMHLSYLLNTSWDSSVIPDIPDDLRKLLQSTSSSDGLTSPSLKQQVIASFLRTTKASSLRNPLQLALLISPLLLLMMKPLTDLTITINRDELVQTSLELGNQQPLELWQMESEILGCLFRISQKPEDLLFELENLITSETWKFSETLPTSHPAITFFNRIGAEPAIASSSGHSYQLEREVGDASPAVQAPVSLSNILDRPNHYFSLPPSHDSVESAPIMGQNMITGPSTEEAEQTVMTTNDEEGDNIITAKSMDEDLQTSDNGESQGQAANQGRNREGHVRVIVNPEGHVRVILNPAVSKNPRTEAASPNDGAAMEVETGGGCSPEPNDAEDEEQTGKEASERNGDAVDVEMEEEMQTQSSNGPEGEKDHDDEDEGEDAHDLVDDGQAQIQDDDEPDVQKGSDRSLRSLTGDHVSKQAPVSSSNNTAGSSKKRKCSTKTKSKKACDYEEVESEEEEEEEDEVIDVDIFETRRVTLDITTQPDKLAPGPDITAYGPRGEMKTFKPSCYDVKTLKMIEDLSKAIEDAYENGKPLHISNPSKSIFRILSEKEADSEAMSVDSIQEILRTQHIVLTDVQTGPRPTTFRQALQPLGAPSTVLTIQDYSIPVTANYNKRKKQGKMVQLADASEQPNGKVLNALDIPMKMAGIYTSPFSSDAHALTATGGRWMSSAPLSVGDFRWALAATAGAFHTWHIDSDGLSTFIQTIVGAKWWIMARPRGDIKNFHAFMNSGIFLDERFDIDNVCTDIWTVEAMLLEPGTKLIMRPNTPHVVFTPDHSVVHGGHLYPRATLQDSLAGIIHCFVAGNWITNTNHTVARFHLQQMIVFCHMAIVEQDIWDDGKPWLSNDYIGGGHIPDPSTADGFMDLLALCCYGILINALDFDTYLHPGQLGYTRTRAQDKEMVDHDMNNLSLKERQSCTYTRGQSLQILECISHTYSLTYQSDSGKGDLQVMRDMQCSSMMSMILEIYSYKARAVKRVPKVEGVPGCTLDLLRLQLANAFPDQHPVYDALSKCQWLVTNEPKPLNFYMDITSLKKSHHSSAFIRRDPANIGINNRDVLYHAWMDVIDVKSEGRASVPPRKRTKVD